MKANSEVYHAELYSKLGNLKHDFRNNNLNNLVASQIKGTRVLDIGCGSGMLLSKLAKEGKEVQGIEPNEDLVQLAQQLNPGTKITRGFADIVLQIDSEVDAITMIDVLAQIEDDSKTVADIYNVLPVGGQFIVVVPAHKFLFGKRDVSNGHLRRYSSHELYSKLKNVGFSIKLIRNWNILGVAPYFIFEKLLKKKLEISLRDSDKLSLLGSIMNCFFNNWIKYIDNNIGFGFGLSLLCVAEKTKP